MGGTPATTTHLPYFIARLQADHFPTILRYFFGGLEFYPYPLSFKYDAALHFCRIFDKRNDYSQYAFVFFINHPTTPVLFPIGGIF
nr:hypothetical protein [Candidatus Sigynarchaeum springense]